MSTNNFLEKLLDGAEVEWVPLGTVAEYSPTRVDAATLDATTFVGVDDLLPGKGLCTIHTHRKRLFARFGVHSKLALVQLGLSWGLGRAA